MGSVVRFLITFLIIYFIYKVIKFLIFPPQRRNDGRRSTYSQGRKKEGETTINHVPDEGGSERKRKPSKDDYIDYEEVE